MAKYTTENIHTVALVGHGGAGKTTLTEALLARTGVIGTPGSTERGSTVSDFDPLEKTYGHSLSASIVNFPYKGIHVHLVDTPGMPDFAGQSIASLAAVDLAVIVINAQNGIELNTTRMMRAAAKRGLDRMILVNKIDGENIDLPGLVERIQEVFGRECLPINLPAHGRKDVVDCFFNPDGEADFSSVKAAHSALVDQVVEVDEALMATYLEQGEELSPEQLHAPFEKALREGHLVPICFASARTGAGVPEFLEILAKLAPNASESNPPPFLKSAGSEGEEFHAEPDPKKHVLAHVFKIIMDPYVGKVAVFRVHQGTMTKETQLFIGSVFHEDRSLLDLIDCDYTFLNERLARHYGVPNVRGDEFRRVTLTDPNRFGLLGKASILMVTAYPNRTSPVLRGAYILENLLGTPPAPPPPNVEAFKENKEGEQFKTIRQIMEAHRTSPSCNACHGVMDPLGLSLENFDTIGTYRDVDRFTRTKIDASGKLVDGTAVNGPADLRTALLAHSDQFVQTLTEKLMTYALGRSVEYYDMPSIRAIVRESKAADYRFSSIVLGIVNAPAFRSSMVERAGSN